MNRFGRVIVTATVVLSAALLAVNCANNDDPKVPETKAAIAVGNNAFACTLYSELRNPGENIVFSPLSVRTALAMTYAGARGETAEQMAQVLRFEEDGESLHAGLGSFLKGLREDSGADSYRLDVANGLWPQEGFAFREEFLELNQEHYDAALRTLDFAGDAEGARQTINTWAREKTEEGVRELIPPGGLDGSTVMVLTNALYFLGSWTEAFDEGSTKTGQFRVSADKTVEAEFMYKLEKFAFSEDDEIMVLELPYAGDRLSMVILLPKETEGIDKLEESLSAEKISEWTGNLSKQKIAIAIPKFKIKYKLELSAVLGEMGMVNAFRLGVADFTGMVQGGGVAIDKVFHDTCVEVNEKGAEAASATGVTIKKMGRVFRADHPFMFLIRDAETGTIIFMGKLADPS